LLKAELGALSDISPNKIEFGGPNLSLPPNAAQALGLALHELATNAVKHGGLGQAAGKLAVAWDVTADSDPAGGAQWQESEAQMPAPGPPNRKGYGSELIERALAYQLSAKTRLEWGPDGVLCEISVPLPRPPDRCPRPWLSGQGGEVLGG
jgi:two-component sensor histidine kinase